VEVGDLSPTLHACLKLVTFLLLYLRNLMHVLVGTTKGLSCIWL